MTKKEDNRKYRQRHKEQIKEYQRKHRQGHKEESRNYLREWKRTHQAEIKEYNRRAYWKSKMRVIEILGSRCRRCGNIDVRVLQVNHINGGGTKDARQILNFYFKIVSGEREKNDLELLCANCNILYEYEQGRRKVGA